MLLVINKIDAPKKYEQAKNAYLFTGFKKVFPISSVTGMGTGDMLDGIADVLKKKGFSSWESKPGEVAVSIIGKPNVGKSSLFNTIIGEDRVVVSNVPGTTRNIVDTTVGYKNHAIRFVDTAGLKRKEKRAELPDIYAAFQTMRTIYKSDMCIFVIDATTGISQQDQRIAGDIVEAGRGLIVAVNKTDLLTAAERTKLERDLEHFFPFLWWAPVVPISAKENTGVDDLLNYILEIEINRHKDIDPETMKEFFKAKLKKREPQRIRDERVPKVFSLTQVHANPRFFG